jgi:geranylgeranyl pyrophosphate synthase
MGAHLGAPEHVAELERFGYHLGMAFQIVDDLLDFCGDEEVMGKRPGTDLRELKATLPMLHAYRSADGPDRERLVSAFRTVSLAPDDEEWLVELAAESGGLDYARAAAARYADTALASLATLPPSEELKGMQAAVGYVLQRER